MSDIVCTVTSSKEPIVKSEWISPGTHLNVVGSSFPDAKEIPITLVEKAKLYVDYKPATLVQAGEVIEALKKNIITEQHIIAEIGELLKPNNEKSIEYNAKNITIYRSLGVAAQDLACAYHLYKKLQFLNLKEYQCENLNS